VLGYGISPDGEKANDLKTSNIAELNGDPRPFIYEIPGVLRNLELLENAATSTGNYMPLPEPDGIVRRIPLFLKQNDKILPWLALEALMVSTGQRTTVVKTSPDGIKEVVLADKILPTDENGRMWVRFREFNKEKFYISASDVLEGNYPKDYFEGKIVFLGASAVGLGDLHTFPFGDAIPGVEMHVQTIEMIMEDEFLYRDVSVLILEAILTFISVAMIIISVLYLGAIKSFIILFSVSLLQLYFSWYLFLEKSILFNPFSIITLTVISYLITTTFAFIRAEKQKAYVKDAFSQYLSPALVSELVKNPDKLKLGGEVKELTLLFCDIRGFTSMSEALKDKPKYLTTIINMLLTELTGVVLKNNGTIDKYMGDALMAFWNAPIDDENHRENAVYSAVELQRKKKNINEKISEFTSTEELVGVPFMKVGVGVATGNVTVGNMGSEQRFNYSVIGDSVNLASRLEGQTKNYGVDNLISEDSLKNIINDVACIEIDKIMVKGKSEPTNVYTILGMNDLLEDEDFKKYRHNHNKMVEKFRLKEFEQAKEYAFEAMTYRKAPSELYALYLDRIEEFKQNPPSEYWDGTFISSSK
jgi:adenylate cyclase